MGSEVNGKHPRYDPPSIFTFDRADGPGIRDIIRLCGIIRL